MVALCAFKKDEGDNIADRDIFAGFDDDTVDHDDSALEHILRDGATLGQIDSIKKLIDAHFGFLHEKIMLIVGKASFKLGNAIGVPVYM